MKKKSTGDLHCFKLIARSILHNLKFLVKSYSSIKIRYAILINSSSL